MVTEKKSREDLANALVPVSSTVQDALKHMDNEVAVIVDEAGRLSGILTDGDIRRAFLTGANMQTPVVSIMTKNPIAFSENLSREEMFSLMMLKQIRHLPIVDSDHKPIGLELLRNQYDENNIQAAVLMAGGKGTRLQPLTYDKPKPLLKVGDSTILDNVLDGLKSNGISEIAISINYLGEQIKEHVKDGSERDLNVSYLEEKEALGTAGALSLLNPRPHDSILVMNADLLTEVDFKALGRFHKKEKNDLSVCVRKIKSSVPYGVIQLKDDNSQISSIVEKPDYEYLVNAGIYMMEPEIIDLIPEKTFFDMVSLIKKAMGAGYKVGAFPIFEYWRDIGQHSEMQNAIKEIQAKSDAKNP